MNMSVVEIIKLGRKYINTWPKRAELASYFAEYRTVQLGRFACNYLPGLALFSLIMQLYLGSVSLLPQALVYSLFILSIPMQVLVMLGVKADKFLPPALASWYKEGVAKVNEGGGDIKLSVHNPRYLDLANLLNVTYSTMAVK